MKHLKKYNDNTNNDYLSKGDLVKLRHNINRDDDDDEYAFSIDKDEIGEIRYLVNDYDNPDYYNQVYMVYFPENKEKQGSKNRGRVIQIMRPTFE